VLARIDDAGQRLRAGEPIPGDAEVHVSTARLHPGRGLTALGAGVVYTWTSAAGWRAYRVDAPGLEVVSLDERGQLVGLPGLAPASRSPICRVTRWTDSGCESLSLRLPWRDWARLKLQGCEKPLAFDAGGPVWIATTSSAWFFDSRAAYVVVLDAGGKSHATYRRDFALCAVRRRASGGALVVGTSGDILDVEPTGRARWLLASRRIRQALRDASGDLGRPWEELMVFGADARDERLVMCVGLYERRWASLVAEAVVEAPGAAGKWSVRALRGVDPTVPWGRWCDLAPNGRFDSARSNSRTPATGEDGRVSAPP
jgi:hypothetical protein